MAVPLDLHVLARVHGAGPGHAPEVVAAEVHEHHVLGTLLGVAAELVGEAVVVGRGGAARPRAGDRVGGQAVADDLEQELRARAHDLERRRPGEEQVRATGSRGGARGTGRCRRAACRRGRPGGRTTGAGPARPGSPRRRRSSPWRARPRGCTRRGRGWPRPGRGDGGAAPRRSPGVASPPASSAAEAGPSAPGPRRSPARRSGSGRRGPAPRVWSDAIADSWWVRWSNTMTRSVSMKLASGTPTGSRSGSGTDGSNVEIASYESAPTAPPVNRGMPSTGATRRRGMKARSAASGSGASEVVTGRSGRVVRHADGPSGRAWRSSRSPRAAGAARCPGSCTGRGARRPRPTRAGTRASRRRRGAGRRRSASRGPRSAWRAAARCRRWRRGAWSRSGSAGRSWVGAPGIENDLDRPGTKGRCSFRGATHVRRCAALLTDGPVGSPHGRSALPCNAGALRRSLLVVRDVSVAPRSVRDSRVHSPSPPSRLAPPAGSLDRRLTGTRPDHGLVFSCGAGV